MSIFLDILLDVHFAGHLYVLPDILRDIFLDILLVIMSNTLLDVFDLAKAHSKVENSGKKQVFVRLFGGVRWTPEGQRYERSSRKPSETGRAVEEEKNT